MIELYCDKLIDLFARGHDSEADKLRIRKNNKGLVVIDGAVMRSATGAEELYSIFEQGSASRCRRCSGSRRDPAHCRHIASTKMNATSSRSHLVIGIVIESTNLTTGQVVQGKLSLVDLAGCVARRCCCAGSLAAQVGTRCQDGGDGTAGTAAPVACMHSCGRQIMEAKSINKSLSALGDVISALSTEQQFIPYRNNVLTELMQVPGMRARSRSQAGSTRRAALPRR